MTMEADAGSGRVPDPDAGGGPATATPPGRRPRRRAVRPGAGDPDPSIGLRSADDGDVGWQSGAGAADAGADDERLLRDVPPHW